VKQKKKQREKKEKKEKKEDRKKKGRVLVFVLWKEMKKREKVTERRYCKCLGGDAIEWDGSEEADRFNSVSIT